MKTEYVLRCVFQTPMPQYAVVKVAADGGGEDVAWFFSANDAAEYVSLKQAKQTNTKGTGNGIDAP